MRHTLFGVQIHDYSREEVLRKLRGWLGENRPRIIVTPNAEFVLAATKNPEFLERLNRADLAVADSVSLRYAIAALGPGLLINRYPGVDLLLTLAKLAADEQKNIMLIGGDPGAAEGARKRLRDTHENVSISVHDPGKVVLNNHHVEISQGTLDEIERIKPDIIAVALGQQKQEAFMEALKHQTSGVKIMIGVGGALDMISGQRKRGPDWMQTAGLEWVWRALIEPKRSNRIASASIIFPIMVAREAAKEQDFIAACKRVLPEVLKQLKSK